MRFTCRSCFGVMCGVLLLVQASIAAEEEPKGLILQKGLVRWKDSLDMAKRFIEADKRPDAPKVVLPKIAAEMYKNVLRGKQFSCEKEDTPGVVHCTWVCCVNLGEKNLLRFATLWFYKDRFFAYKVAFDTNDFSRFAAGFETRFGKPTKEETETKVNPNPLACQYTACSYVVRTRHWEMETTRISVADRGGNGHVNSGEMTVIYRPIAKEMNEAGKERKPNVVLPF